jgi:hypothetical protein
MLVSLSLMAIFMFAATSLAQQYYGGQIGGAGGGTTASATATASPTATTSATTTVTALARTGGPEPVLLITLIASLMLISSSIAALVLLRRSLRAEG